MAAINVYRADFYDIRNDEMQRSRRWFTREGAQLAGGVVVERTVSVIDSSLLEDGQQWTVRDFNPRRRRDEFQRQVIG
jgi:hypothetical protein